MWFMCDWTIYLSHKCMSNYLSLKAIACIKYKKEKKENRSENSKTKQFGTWTNHKLKSRIPYEMWRIPSSDLFWSHCPSPCRSVKQFVHNYLLGWGNNFGFIWDYIKPKC